MYKKITIKNGISDPEINKIIIVSDVVRLNV